MVYGQDAEAKTFVTQTLGSILQEFPREVQQHLVAKFCEEYVQPMTNELELVLGKRLTDDEVRHLLFRPNATQYRYYATLLALVNSRASDESSSLPPCTRTLQRRFLTQFYLQHARNWPLVEDFCNHDGLNVLVELFVDEDLQVRGQAIDSFVQLTSHPSFDWFLKPIGHQAEVLHQRLLALAAPPSQFLRHLFWNIQLYSTSPAKTIDPTPGNESQGFDLLPGGTHVLLQILAFYLSWVRKLYTKHNELRLSRELLALLSEWAERTRSEDPSELALAMQVYEDFSRWPAIEDGEQQDISANGNTIALLSPEPQSKDNQEITKAAQFSRQYVLDLLERDDLDQHIQAIELCTAAIDAGMCLVDAHLLRAQAIRKSLKHRESATARADLQRCLNDCNVVLQLDPCNIQAWRCKLKAFATMEMWSQGCEIFAITLFLDTETMQKRFLDGDIEYFHAQRLEFTKQAQLQAERKAQNFLEQAEKERKVKEIYSALLQRGKATTTSKIDPRNDAFQSPKEQVRKMEETSLSEAVKHPVTATDMLLKRIAKTPPKKPSAIQQHDGSTKTMVRGRAFVRKFHACKANPSALSELLMATAHDDLRIALESSLSEESFLSILQALESRKDLLQTQSEEHDHLTSIWQTLTHLTRFQLFVEMAPVKTRDALSTSIQHLHDAQMRLSGAGSLGS